MLLRLRPGETGGEKLRNVIGIWRREEGDEEDG